MIRKIFKIKNKKMTIFIIINRKSSETFRNMKFEIFKIIFFSLLFSFKKNVNMKKLIIFDKLWNIKKELLLI